MNGYYNSFRSIARNKMSHKLFTVVGGDFDSFIGRILQLFRTFANRIQKFTVYLFTGDEPIGFLHSPRHFAVKSGAHKVLCRNIRRERRRCRSSGSNTRDLQNFFRKAVHTIILSFPLIISAKRY